MSAGDRTPARRVGSMEELTQAGDYFYNPDSSPDAQGERSLWFLLPIHRAGAGLFDRDRPGDGLHRISSPRWTVTENPDGSVSAQPSIGCGVPPYYWHGYLDPGNIWREV